MTRGSKNKPVTLLISHERSGSHLFGELVRSLAETHVFDEVCNARAIDPWSDPKSFLGFRKRWGDENPDFWWKPSSQTQSEMVIAFFDHLRGLAPDKNVLVHIKYGHIHNFEWYWFPIFRRPFLFETCRSHGFRIIHLHRLNVMEAVVSDRLAEQRKLWASSQPRAEELMRQSHRIDAARVVQEIEQLAAQILWIQKYWLPGTQFMDVTYEELVGAVNKENNLRRRVADFLGATEEDEFVPKLKKVTFLKEAIVNFAEIRQVCQERGLGYFF
jgi:LPS sulfotransferase NodH